MFWRFYHRLRSLSSQYRDLFSTLFILIALVLLFEATQLLGRVNNIVFDLGQQWGAKTKPIDDIVIVTIDQLSLESIGSRTLPRNIHAALIERLSQAEPAVIAYDVIFAEPDLQSPQYDRLLIDAVKRAGNVVFPVLFEQAYVNGPIRETMPIDGLRQASAALGSVHAVLGVDSISRGVYLFEGINLASRPLFATSALAVAKAKLNKQTLSHLPQPVPASSHQALLRKDFRLVNFSGKPGYFKTISLSRVIAGDFLPEDFRHKIVLVGATAVGMNDMLSTPMSAKSVPMPGVEFHANVIQSMRDHSLITPLSNTWALLIQLLLSCLPLLWLPKISPRLGFAFTVLYSSALLMIFALVPTLLCVWCPFATAFVVSFIAFPVWSWRKLEATQHYINLEIVKLNQKLNNENSSVLLNDNYDYLDRRIMHLRQAAARIEQLQAEKDDTLTFLSHDIKAPLATALLMVSQKQTSEDMLRKPLEQAFTLAESFLQTARAERFDASQMDEVELINLVQQAIDDAYHYAKEHQIKIITDFAVLAVWLEGNYGLLSRSIFNLVHNAVKYSVATDDVTVRISLDTNYPQHVLIEVANTGEGISEDKIAHLFKRFQRLSQHEESHEGTGLGLYFTKVVIEKHAGHISVDCKPQALHTLTTFKISLPYSEVMLAQ